MKLGNLEVWRLGSLGVLTTRYTIPGAYRKRFGNPGGLEAREPRGLEARRLGGGADDLREHPGSLGLEIQEAWKLGNLEV